MRGKRVAVIGLVVGCGLMALLSGCSNNQGETETKPSATVGQSGSTQEATGNKAPPTPVPAAEQTPPPAGGGVCSALLTDKCTGCHSTNRVCTDLGKKSSTRWKRTINRMIERGAKLNPDEAATLLTCLDNGASNDLQDACR